LVKVIVKSCIQVSDCTIVALFTFKPHRDRGSGGSLRAGKSGEDPDNYFQLFCTFFAPLRSIPVELTFCSVLQTFQLYSSCCLSVNSVNILCNVWRCFQASWQLSISIPRDWLQACLHSVWFPWLFWKWLRWCWLALCFMNLQCSLFNCSCTLNPWTPYCC